MPKTIGLFSLVLLAVLFLGVNVAADRALSGVRLDLTEGRLYTIQPASRRIAASPEEPIRMRFYFSKDLARGIPQVETFGRRVTDLLREFEAASGGKIELSIINPEPFSEAEDEAVAEGMSPQPVSATENLYFGLVATNSLDGREVIPLFRPSDERFLEYRVSQLITKLASPKKPRIGLITSLPMLGGFDPRMQRPRPEWAVIRDLRASFEVEQIEETAGAIPEGLDALLVVHPKNLTPQTEYAIDQFVLKGGRAAFFVDPICESDQSQSSMGMQVGGARSSNLERLFGAWGLSMAPGEIAGDLNLAISVRTPGPRQEVVPYVIWLDLGKDQFPADDPVTRNFTRVNIASGGSLSLADDAKVSWEPLLSTTDQAATVPVARVEVMPDPKALLNEFFPSGTPIVMGARVTGTPPSAFPEGPPQAEGEEGEASGAGGAPAGHLAEASGPIHVIVVADADMLEDGGWVREIRVGPALLGYDILADNGAFVLNAMEQMTGSTDLLALRARGSFSRPFTLMQEMQREAEAEFLAKEQTLVEEIEQTRQRINDLQMARADAGTPGSLVLTPEQQKEVDDLNAVLVEKRKELREVQLNLRKDIEALETRLKAINTGLVPLLLCGFALSLGGYRAARRRADRKRGSAR
jgi:ABC-type uncharacterized transport system involved in gliding motility auxiliary subunit